MLQGRGRPRRRGAAFLSQSLEKQVIRILPPILAILFISLIFRRKPSNETSSDTPSFSSSGLSYVDLFIGTGGHGHTYPGVSLPFGMVQLSPDNGLRGWDWASGYHISENRIVGFSHTHLSGTGIGSLVDVSLLPTNDAGATAVMSSHESSKLPYNHSDEVARPGYYRTLLANGAIQAELTATKRVGMHRYTFYPSKTSGNDNTIEYDTIPGLYVNLGLRGENDIPYDTGIQVFTSYDNTTMLVQGHRYSYTWDSNHTVYFAMEFNSLPSYFELAESEEEEGDGVSRACLSRAIHPSMARGSMSSAYFRFENGYKSDEPYVLMVNVGISFTSPQGALDNLRKELPLRHWDFDSVSAEVEAEWRKELSSIQVEGEDESAKRIFYTALYHTKVAPTLHSDVNGEFHGPAYRTGRCDGFNYYSALSIWDIFRAEFPLLTLTNPDIVKDIVLTMLAHADQTDQSILPVWNLCGKETWTMSGYHAVSMIAEAIHKGIITERALIERAFWAMNSTAHTEPAVKMRGVDLYNTYGYVPSDKMPWSVSTTLEYGYDDWCIAQVAKALGKNDAADYFSKRSEAYKGLYDASTGFMRPKTSDGRWKEPFTPDFSDRSTGDFIEGNAWQHMWFVPHHVKGLIDLMGGEDAFEARLDALFRAGSKLSGGEIPPDISGLIGQYVHGNEPSHHVPYLYNYANKPHRTQERVQEIMALMYKDGPDGYAGNEDCGQMSAWYIFTAFGFYPVNPAEGRYQLGIPFFDRVVFNLPNKKKFEIQASGMSKAVKEKVTMKVRKVLLNGKELKERLYITHEEILAGGVLKFDVVEWT